MGDKWCSPEVTLIGILRVVEELRAKKPGSTIVINGLLPRSFDRKDGFVMPNRPRVLDKIDNKPALWYDILAINSQLREYSMQHQRVEYFDASNIFLVDETLSANELQIDVNLMRDYLHPTANGYKVWGEKIVKRLDQLIGTWR